MIHSIDELKQQISGAHSLADLLSSAGELDLSALSDAELAALRASLWDKYCAELRESDRYREHQARKLSYTEPASGSDPAKTWEMKFNLVTVKDSPRPSSGYPLYIVLHGGGNTAADRNDEEYLWMQTRYQDSVQVGHIVAVRAITDDHSNCHSIPASYVFYDRLIENFIAFEEVDPNAVYVLGYSAGGDGVYQIASNMADRFAAACTSAGHPNGASPINLGNLPFLIQMGELDCAYDRSSQAVDFAKKLKDHASPAQFGETFKEPFLHDCFIHKDQLHSGVCDDDLQAHAVIADPEQWRASAWRKINWKDNTSWTLDHSWRPVPANFSGTWRDDQQTHEICEAEERDGTIDRADNGGLTYSAYHLNEDPDEKGSHYLFLRDGTKVFREAQDPGTLYYDLSGEERRGAVDSLGRSSRMTHTGAPAWLQAHPRNPVPQTVVWDRKTTAPLRNERADLFYWLQTQGPASAEDDKPIKVHRSGDQIVVEDEPSWLVLWLRRSAAEADQSLTIAVGGRKVKTRPARTAHSLITTLLDRGDRAYMFDSRIAIDHGEVYPPEATTREAAAGRVSDPGKPVLAFCDAPVALLQCAPIRQVLVRHGEIINAVQVSYGANKVALPMHGGDGGTQDVFELEADDRLTEVSGCYETWENAIYITRLLLKTKKGKSSKTFGDWSQVGTWDSFKFTCEEGEQILALHGATAEGPTHGGETTLYVSGLGVVKARL